VAVGYNVLCYRGDDGTFSVGHIDSSGHLVERHSSGVASNWTNIVAVG
jgi:hypothetical protein